MATQVTLNSGSVDSAGSLALKTNGTTTAVTINASQGVEFNAGAVGTPSITTTGDTNTGIFFPAADTIAFSEGGVEAMRIDSDGDVGIGTNSPATKFHVASGAVTVQGATSTTGRIGIFNNAASTSGFLIGQGFSSGTDNVGYVYNTANAAVAFGTNDIERMRIDSSGNVGIGTSSPLGRLQISGATPTDLTGGYSQLNIFSTDAIGANKGGRISFGGVSGASGFDPYGFCAIAGLKDNATASNFSGYLTFSTSTSGGSVTERMRIDSSGNLLVGTTSSVAKLHVLANAAVVDPVTVSNSDSGSGSQFAIVFRRNTSTVVGSIQTTNVATSYVTSSDYRLKENIAPMIGALAKVQTLKPCTYKWKVDGSDGQGFIAHELQEVCPDAVTGEKDGEEMQGVDYGKLTPILTAALQEAIAKIETLEARISALEAK